ncbi:MAG: RecX family transcriptional regulator [Solirubrobacterales bacterium]|nr:RecX family transcriptional regulator [Solirubrobacterales bacterium]
MRHEEREESGTGIEEGLTDEFTMGETAAEVVDPELRLQQALDVAYAYLAKRDRTVREVRRRLEEREVDPVSVEEALAELTDAGMLDDSRYAARFAEDRRNLDSWGASRIERRLVAVGVASEHIEAALHMQEGEDEFGAALAALRRRYADPLPDPSARERALGYLVRKGYAMEIAYDAIRAHAREED